MVELTYIEEAFQLVKLGVLGRVDDGKSAEDPWNSEENQHRACSTQTSPVVTNVFYNERQKPLKTFCTQVLGYNSFLRKTIALCKLTSRVTSVGNARRRWLNSVLNAELHRKLVRHGLCLQHAVQIAPGHKYVIHPLPVQVIGLPLPLSV